MEWRKKQRWRHWIIKWEEETNREWIEKRGKDMTPSAPDSSSLSVSLFYLFLSVMSKSLINLLAERKFAKDPKSLWNQRVSLISSDVITSLHKTVQHLISIFLITSSDSRRGCNSCMSLTTKKLITDVLSPSRHAMIFLWLTREREKGVLKWALQENEQTDREKGKFGHQNSN